MANERISQLPAAQTITGTELVPVVQNGQTVQTTVSAIAQSPSLTQTFITVGQQPLLPNSRFFATGLGIGFTDGGAQGSYSIALNGTSASLENAGSGFISKTGANTVASRSLTTTGNGVSVVNGDGIAGNPVFQLTGLAAAIANATGTGILGLNGSAITPLEIVGTASEIDVLYGNGAGVNPTIRLADNAVFPGTAGVVLPNGTNAERGSTQGQIRYNTDTNRFEGKYSTGWQQFGIGDGAITSVAGTPNQISVSTVGGAATVSIDPDPVIPGNGAIQIPSGTTAQRPGGANGDLRYNSSTGTFEGYANGAWGAIISGSGVTSVGTGTGLTGGPITSAGVISIANTGVTAASYGSASTVPVLAVNAQGQITSASNATIAIPSSAITDKGLPNGVASLDAGGTVPTSQLPAAVLGALKYQGTWNASTNTPTLTSSVGTQGYYYVVDVAGSTNLNGITDWKIGDWAIFNGSVWQKIDNTDAVTSVNGYTGTVVLTYTDVGAFPATATTGTGNVVLQNSPSISSPTIDGANPYIQFANGSAVTVAAGKLWYNGATGGWNAGMGGGNITQQIGEELFRYGKASSAITDSPLQIVYKTGVVGASRVITFAPTVAGITDPDLIIGVATESISNNNFGRVTTYGIVNKINTTGSAYGEVWADGDDIWYNPVTGNPTKNKPSAPNIKLQIGTVINAGAGSGSFIVKLGNSSTLGGTDSNVQLGTLSNADLLQYYSAGAYWRNVAPSAISGVGSVANAVTFNNSGTGDASGTTYNGSAVKTISYNTIGAQAAGTYVTSVSATAPVASSGGTTPTISMSAANSTTNGYLTSTDWNTFNNKGSGSVTSVAASVPSFLSISGSPITTSGTLAISYSGTALPIANGGTAATSFTAKSGNIAGLVFYDGTKLTNDATVTDVGYDTTTNTIIGKNASISGQGYSPNQNLSDAATVAWDMSLGQVATFTFVSSNRSMGAPTNLVNGAFYALAVIQNAGSNTLTWNSVFKWAGGIAPTLSTAAGAKDYFVFRSDGTNLYQQGISQAVA